MNDQAPEEFRARARQWLETHAPRSRGGDVSSGESDRDPADITMQKVLQANLYDAGLAGMTWPREYGGQGLSPVEQVIFGEEARPFDLALEAFRVGLGMAGPTILELGTEQQKLRYLPPLLRGDQIWCQLFSEPEAGSDIASLRTKATRDGDGWRLTGQKVWTSGAQYADFGIALARTDPTVPKHQGITMFIIDMHAVGVTVRPLKVATGEAPFNEVFLDDVVLPAEAVLGAVDKGWEAALVTLKNERLNGASGEAEVRINPLSFDALVQTARAIGTSSDQHVKHRLAEAYARELGLRCLGQRLREEVLAGKDPAARGSMTKLGRAELRMFLVGVASDVLQSDVVAVATGSSLDPTIMAMIRNLESSIAGGTNEIQRNIIGERLLGLDKDPRPDKGQPFTMTRANQGASS